MSQQTSHVFDQFKSQTQTQQGQGDGSEQNVALNQFLDSAAHQHISSSDAVDHDSNGEAKNVVIIMQPSQQQQQQQQHHSGMQELTSLTANPNGDGSGSNLMVSSAVWTKTETLVSDDSSTNTFITPPPPPPQRPTMDRNKTATWQPPDEENYDDDTISNPCLVCGDKASGYHYSVFSCEGCKGFFKRSVQKGLAYSCKDNGACHINKFSRNSCQFCRFQKCLLIGMKREAVREDRSPGGKHRHKRQCIADGFTRLLQDLEGPYKDIRGELKQPLLITKVEEENLTENPLLESLLSAKPHLYPKGGSEKTEGLSVNELMQYGYLELRFIIEWAKKVPGFSDLSLTDQMSLLKSSFMELNVLRLAYRSMHLDNKIKFAEDVILPLDYCESIGWGRELVDGIIDFAHKLKEISLNLPEFCIINAMILMYPDAQSLEDRAGIAELQTHILDCLRQHLLQHHPQDHKRLGKILLRLPALRTVSAKAAERFLSLTFDGSVELNELVLEMMN